MPEQGDKNISSPHYGIPGFDTEAKPGYLRESEEKQQGKKKEIWYTAHTGISYRTGRFGSDAGDYAGTIEQDTPIKLLTKAKPVNGIVSIFAEFKIGEEIRRGWFSMDDIRRAQASKKK